MGKKWCRREGNEALTNREMGTQDDDIEKLLRG